MEKSVIKSVQLTPENGKVLVKMVEKKNGKYRQDDKRYNIIVSKNVFATETDVANWQEADSLEAFMKENKIVPVKE